MSLSAQVEKCYISICICNITTLLVTLGSMQTQIMQLAAALSVCLIKPNLAEWDNYSKQQVGFAAVGLFVLWHLSSG